MGVVWCDFVRFSFHKTAHCIAQCGVVHYHLWCGVVHYHFWCGVITPFWEWFWSIWMRTCSLRNLVNAPSSNY